MCCYSCTVGRVVEAGGVAVERTPPGGRVLAAGCVAGERKCTVGRIAVASGVVLERIKTGGRVVAAGCVARERKRTVGRVRATLLLASASEPLAVLE